MRTEKWLAYIPTVVVVLLIAFYRLLPHPWNFTPVCATAIFGGIYLNKKYAIALPLLSMIVADSILGFDWMVTPVIYACIALSALIGAWIKNERAHRTKFIVRTLGGTIASAVIFFIWTNFATWLAYDTYTKDMAGLIQCYIMAIPFFRNSLGGDLLFISVFIAIYELLSHAITARLKPVVVNPK
ncbi:hypothetical protein K1X84_04175 [bacterium]|nr:hypothetical protein [bacterium]